MKKLLLFIFVVVAFYSQAQNNCANALPFCAGGTSGVTFPATTSTPQTAAQPGPFYDCLSTVPNPAWYFLQINNSGTLDILIQGLIGSPPVAGQDVDFICWGPFNTLAGICNSLTAANVIDCSYSSSYTETLNIPNGITGQYYMVLITNFANIVQNIAFNQYGGTGNTNCALLTNRSICAGNNATIVAVNSNTLSNPSYTLLPGGLTNTTGTFITSPLVTTSYTTYLSGTNNVNVLITQTAVTNVTVNPQPSSAPTTTQTTCTSTLNALNLGLSFFPASPVPTYTIVWTPVPVGIVGPAQTTATGGIAPGTYTAVITAQGGCSNTAVVNISSPPSAAIFTLLPVGSLYSVTCSQPTVVLDASIPAYNYTWTNGSTAPLTGVTNSFTAFNLGNWTVTAVDPISNCTSNRTFTVVLNNNPPQSSVSPVNQSVTCGPGVVATATGVAINPTVNVTHSWYAPGLSAPYSNGGQLSIYNPIVGTSTFVLTNNLNGCSTTKTVQVVSIGGNYPTFSVTSVQSQNTFTLGCSTKSVTDVVIAGAQTTPQGGALSYTILAPAYTGTNYVPNTQTAYTVNVPGTYTVIVKDNVNQCETRLPLSVVQNTFGPDISTSTITRTLSCTTPSVVLIGNSTTQNVTYNWKTNIVPPTVLNDTLIVKTTTAGASVPSATLIDTYTLTIRDEGNLCLSNTVVPMYQNTRPPKAAIALSNPALTCIVYSVNLSNNSSTGILPGTFFVTQNVIGELWEGPTPQQPQNNSSTYLGYVPGIYTMTARDLNNGCSAQTTTVLGDNRQYPVLSTNTLIALDCGASATGGVKLAVQALNLTPAAITAQWYIPQTSPNITNPNTLTLTTDGVGDYKLVVTTNSNGCTASVLVKVINGVLNANFTADQVTGYAPFTVNFTNNSASSSTVSGTSSITAVWSFGNGTTKTTTVNTLNAGTSAVYTQPGTYTVTMFASKGSCIDTFVKVIRVDIPSKLDVPNVFTPNGDNSNDLFFVRTANLVDITAMIFDRWGNKIYELATEKGNIAWDGKNQAGKEVPDGTYFYIIKATGRDGVSYDTKGTVSLYR